MDDANKVLQLLKQYLDEGSNYYDARQRLINVGSYYYNEQGNRGPEIDQSTKTAKSTLADMIVDTISGKHDLGDTLDYDEEQAVLAELGLESVHFLRTDQSTGAVTLLSTIVK